jgi:hypothetical protein
MNKDITLTGLTAKQVMLLNEMWSKDTQEEFDEWKETLTLSNLKQVILLSELVNLEILDQQVTDYSMAKKLIEELKWKK